MNKMVRIRKEALDFYGTKVSRLDSSSTGVALVQQEEEKAVAPPLEERKAGDGEQEGGSSPPKSTFATSSVANVVTQKLKKIEEVDSEAQSSESEEEDSVSVSASSSPRRTKLRLGKPAGEVQIQGSQKLHRMLSSIVDEHSETKMRDRRSNERLMRLEAKVDFLTEKMSQMFESVQKIS